MEWALQIWQISYTEIVFLSSSKICIFLYSKELTCGRLRIYNSRVHWYTCSGRVLSFPQPSPTNTGVREWLSCLVNTKRIILYILCTSNFLEESVIYETKQYISWTTWQYFAPMYVLKMTNFIPVILKGIACGANSQKQSGMHRSSVSSTTPISPWSM